MLDAPLPTYSKLCNVLNAFIPSDSMLAMFSLYLSYKFPGSEVFSAHLCLKIAKVIPCPSCRALILTNLTFVCTINHLY